MNTSAKDLLISLLALHGPTGHEEPVANWLETQLRGHVDSLHTDALGNLIAIKKGAEGGKRLLISAHMDHIGLMVMDADDQGFLRVCTVGGVGVPATLRQHVVFRSGACGVVGVEQDIEGEPKPEHLYIDVGASTREEALAIAGIGEIAVYAAPVRQLGERKLAAPAMDDRVGCALLAWLLLNAPDDCPNELIGVFSSQEEVGCRGARVAAYAQEPDIGLALDVTPAGDTPAAKPKLPVQLGKGPTIKVMDRASISSPMVRDALLDAAKAAGIACQLEVLPYGGTDAGVIQTSRGGVPSGTLSVATRYVHSAAETIDLVDLEQSAQLLLAFAKRKF